MHKLVNGERVELTPEEQEEIKAQWAQGEIEAKKARDLEEIKKAKPCDSDKLEACYEWVKAQAESNPLPKLKVCLDKEKMASDLQKNLV